MTTATIALIGNPNCGKTTLFNALTGARQRVGNWPGVTVEKVEGHIQHGPFSLDVVDLPGVYSLYAGQKSASLDEQVAQQFILQARYDLILNIIDASNLERNLYLTSQLLEAGIPMVVVLNMTDVAHANGVHLDALELAQHLGCPVQPVIASKGDGLAALMDTVVNSLHKPRCPIRPPCFTTEIMAALDMLSQRLPSTIPAHRRQLLAMGALEEDAALLANFALSDRPVVASQIKALETQLNDRIDNVLATQRYLWISQTIDASVTLEHRPTRKLSELIDAVVLNRFGGIPLFLFAMYLMFMLTMNVGSAFIDFFDGVAAAIFVEGSRLLLVEANAPDWLITLLSHGIGGGIQLVSTFIPIIACLFFCLSFLEDSGYMARAAFIVDRVMQSIGLPGKAFVPLIVGFGCNVPSVMAARTLEHQHDRVLTVIMAPFMSCGARLTVYTLFAAVFFPHTGQNVVFGLYLAGIVLAILSAFLFRRTMLKGETASFVMELPPYHIPTLKGLSIRTWHRLQGFVVRAGKAIVAVYLVMGLLSAIGTDGSFGEPNRQDSIISAIGKGITPAFHPMGIEDENWPATVGLFTGLFAKEVVVGTLNALYSDADTDSQSVQDWSDLTPLLLAAWESIPANLAQLAQRVGDPLGLEIGDLGNRQEAAVGLGVNESTLTAMSQQFHGESGALAYLLFILLYAPCIATIGALYKESGTGWAAFACGWSLLLGYSVSVIFYQTLNWQAAPLLSAQWIASMLALLCAGTWLLIQFGKHQASRSRLIPVIQLS